MCGGPPPRPLHPYLWFIYLFWEDSDPHPLPLLFPVLEMMDLRDPLQSWILYSRGRVRVHHLSSAKGHYQFSFIFGSWPSFFVCLCMQMSGRKKATTGMVIGNGGHCPSPFWQWLPPRIAVPVVALNSKLRWWTWWTCRSSHWPVKVEETNRRTDFRLHIEATSGSPRRRRCAKSSLFKSISAEPVYNMEWVILVTLESICRVDLEFLILRGIFEFKQEQRRI